MTNKEFDNYLALVTRLLRINGKHSEELGSEMRDHLETRVCELSNAGIGQEEATRRALEEFGDAASLAHRFQLVSQNSQKRWMMRFATLSVAAMFLLVVFVFSMWPDNAKFGSPGFSVAQEEGASAESLEQSETTRQNQLVVTKLQEEVALAFDETPFADVMADLAETLNVNIVLDRSASEDQLSEDDTITFNVKNIPLSSSLGLMLENHNATYVVDRGVLKIISRDDANDPSYFRRTLVDSRRLIAKLQSLNSERAADDLPAKYDTGGPGGDIDEDGSESRGGPRLGGQDRDDRSGPGGTSASAGGGFGGGQARVYRPMHSDSSTHIAENIIDVIKVSITPDGWDDTNGDATISNLYGILVVVAPERTIQQIRDFLQDFEHNLDK